MTPRPSTPGQPITIRRASALALAAGFAFWFSDVSLSAQAPEVQTRESSPNFSLRVERNLVVVRVVARDSAGKLRGDLSQNDFLLFDNGKPQTIMHFAVEHAFPEASAGTPPALPPQPGAPPGEGVERSPKPLRYLALYFDDVHMDFDQIVRTRDAAERYLGKELRGGDHVGIFTSSGHNGVDFTRDPEKIHANLAALQPRPVVQQGANPCPNISEYQAYLMVERHDPDATEFAVRDLLNCQFNNDPRMYKQAQEGAQSEAFRRMSEADVESEYSLREMEQVIRRMATLPGQRTLVMISPGLLTITLQAHVDQIMDRALRSNVIINTLEARGLDASPALPLGDATEQAFVPMNNPALRLPPTVTSDLAAAKARWVNEAFLVLDDPLAEFAGDTGGVFFHNNNSMDEGFERVGSFPSVYYTLAFSPVNLKRDGRFHTIKVKLARPGGFEVEARRGYFAPSNSAVSADKSAAEIEDAVFSQDDSSNFAAGFDTEYYRLGRGTAQLAVLTRMDMRFVRFRKEEGRNRDDLTVVVAVFDTDGNLVTAKQKRLELRLRDESLARLRSSGLTMKTSFEMKPGAYVVRQVVRDDSDAEFSALSRPVDISF
jgi:VWFA-related protein